MPQPEVNVPEYARSNFGAAQYPRWFRSDPKALFGSPEQPLWFQLRGQEGHGPSDGIALQGVPGSLLGVSRLRLLVAATPVQTTGDELAPGLVVGDRTAAVLERAP